MLAKKIAHLSMFRSAILFIYKYNIYIVQFICNLTLSSSKAIMLIRNRLV